MTQLAPFGLAPRYRGGTLRSLAELKPPSPPQDMPSGSVQSRRWRGRASVFHEEVVFQRLGLA